MPRLVTRNGIPYEELGNTGIVQRYWWLIAIGGVVAVWWYKRSNPGYYVESYENGAMLSRLGPFKNESRARGQMTVERRMGLKPRLRKATKKLETLS